MNNKLAREMKEISESIKGLDLEKSLFLIDKKREELPSEYSEHIDTMIGEIYWQHGKTKISLEKLYLANSIYNNRSYLNYSIGEKLVELSKYEEAVSFLSTCISSEAQNLNKWYTNSATILRCFCYIKTSRLFEAKIEISTIPYDESITWLKTKPKLDRAFIEEQIVNQ